MQYASEQGIEIIAYEANGNEESLVKTMKLARKEGLRAYILSSPTISAKRIIQIAQKKQLATANFHWFIPNVFVDPDEFLDISRSGVRMTFLSSPVITPLVRGLMTKYAASGINVTSDIVYNDVIKALARLAVENLFQACQLKNCGAMDESGQKLCAPLPHEINYSLVTPRTNSRSFEKRSVPAEPTQTVPPSDACEVNMGRDTVCQRISKILTQGEPYTSMEERKHLVQVESLQTLVARVADQDKRQRSKRQVSDFQDSDFIKCPTFKWPTTMSSYITGSAEETTLALQYESNAGLCANAPTYYEWIYKEGSYSKDFLRHTEITHANSILITEVISRSKSKKTEEIIIAGVFNGNQASLNITYSPFSVTDIQLPQRPLLVCAVWQPPWLSWESDPKTGELIFEGYLFEVLTHLSTSMNFTYEMVMHPDFNSQHRLTAEELEAAMYNMFENDSCDFFLHTKSIRGGRMGRAETVDLSLALQQPSMFLLTQRLEKTQSIDIWQFMTPFHEESWIYLWSCFILVSLFLAWINTKNPYEYLKIAASFGPDSEPSDHLGVLNSLWFNFSSIVQQGVDIVPRSKAAKMLTGTWWFFGLTIITAYTANMTLFMTQGNKGGIETLDELASQKEFAYGIMYDNPMLTLFLPDAKERPYTLLYNYLKKEWNGSVFYSHQDAFDKILAGNFYLMASFETAVEALATSCQFDKVGSGFYQYQFALPFPKGSLVIPLFNDHIAKLRDRGTLSMLEEKWFSLESACEDTNVAKTLENQLDIKAFIGMYVFLIIGCSIGVFICIAEIAWVRFGGVSGMVGKARKYEFKENRRENRKTLDLLEDEFTKWEGGWEVWKFKEWSNHGNPNALDPGDKKAELEKRIRESTMKHALHTCNLCGKTVKPKDEKQAAAPYRSTIVVSEKKPEDSVSRDLDSGRSSAASGLLNEVQSPAEQSEKRDHSSETGNYTAEHVTLPVPLPLIPQEETTTIVDRDLPQTTTRADILRQNFARTNLSSMQSHSSLASGTLSIPGIHASDWTISTKFGGHDVPDSSYDDTVTSSAIAPPGEFSEPSHYYDALSSGLSSSFCDDSWSEGGSSHIYE
uniref:Glutamate receptor ionotropic, kainate 1-like n=1 Tax=Phallusia mammillata TaxID=59560 RepID=A0A6F9DES7_9ASCI|nr:glutamate receptor ionotropic, kainate 1-like [Phallusia mammillata]